MSYTQSYYHIVFSTYRRKPTILLEHDRELYAYIYGIATGLGSYVFRIGGMPDHIHIFATLPATLSLSSFVQRIKGTSSKWLKENPSFPDFRGWEHEYSAFSYGSRDRDMIIGYIRKQKEHHRTRSFSDEYRSFLEENDVVIDERYFLLDD